MEGLTCRGKFHFKIDWASHMVGSKFTIFALFYFVFEGNFPSTSPRGAYIRNGNLTEVFLGYWFGRLIFGGAYTWRGLFSEFYSMRYLKNQIFITTNFSHNDIKLLEKSLHIEIYNPQKSSKGLLLSGLLVRS